MGKIMALDGNAAIAYGVMKANVELVAAYPITPQTPIVETIASLIDKGKYDATYINVESEHSALSAVVGGASAGVRCFTASASHGLALMHEMTGIMAGSRLPAVMAVVNRALPSPCCLWCDHSDIMTERDQGWLQIFAKSPQEALDFVLIAYKTSEHPQVMLPTMIAIDGFYLSHLTEAVHVPEDDEAGEFLQAYEPSGPILDVNEPYALNNLSSPEIFTEIKYTQKVAFDRSLSVLQENFDRFGEIFGRHYQVVEGYRLEDAETAIVCLGSMAGTVQHVVDLLRAEGKKVGLLRVISFRPFPFKQVVAKLRQVKQVAVIDRVFAGGSFGPLYEEVLAGLALEDARIRTYNFVAGLGGRDIWEKTVRDVVAKTEELSNAKIKCETPYWIDLKK